MSYSSLWGIDHGFNGKELKKYHNSMLIESAVCIVLADKILGRDKYGYIRQSQRMDGSEEAYQLNCILNRSENTTDRVVWEIINEQIFFTKDKDLVAESILKFCSDNAEYGKERGFNWVPLEKDGMLEKRLKELAKDIKELDKNEFPCFVIKATSCNDEVEYWFKDFNEELEENVSVPLYWCTKHVAEFVIIEEGKITDFIPNNSMNYSQAQEWAVGVTTKWTDQK